MEYIQKLMENIPKYNNKLIYKKNDLNYFKNIFSDITKKIESKNPFIVGINGGNGSGKSTFAKYISDVFEDVGINTNIFSLDDFYLSLEKRKIQYEYFNKNPLYKSRGLPGTHNTRFFNTQLEKYLNYEEFEIPKFDKSLHKGEGDVVLNKKYLEPINPKNKNLCIIEGWCVGIKEISYKDFVEHCNKEKIKLNYNIKYYEKILEFIPEYQKIWDKIDYNIIIQAEKLELHSKWRYEQEKRDNKGKMNEEKIRKFVNPYLPFISLCNKLKSNSKLYLNEEHRFVDGPNSLKE